MKPKSWGTVSEKEGENPEYQGENVQALGKQKEQVKVTSFWVTFKWASHGTVERMLCKWLYRDMVLGDNSTLFHFQNNYSSHIHSMTLGDNNHLELWFPVKGRGSAGFILKGGNNDIECYNLWKRSEWNVLTQSQSRFHSFDQDKIAFP